MKKQALLLLILIFTISSYGQIKHTTENSPKNILDSIIAITKKESIYRSAVDWSKLEKKVYAIFIDSDTITSIIKPTQYILSEIGDYHGFLVLNGKQYGVEKKKIRSVTYDYTIEGYKEKRDKIISMLIEKKEIEARLINDAIAYIEIPFLINNFGIDSINLNYTLKLRKAIRNLSKKKPKGYIIDLRRNLGGSVHPMISGIGALFNNKNLGGTTKDGKTYDSTWTLKNGNFYFGANSLSNIPEITSVISTEGVPIVVLLGRYTASSGEIVAAALKGQYNVKLIGEQTAGYSTTNGWYPVGNTISINPSISFYMSEDKTIHKDGILPDIELIEDLNLDDLFSGDAMNEAIKWIRTGFKNIDNKE